ncbi:protein kinase [Streptomyces sp. NPDC051018]|uniref:serine/threonine-protein kinase n=1 Tax=Streptomyces sp. NPDC051018 TaxID=3365639 RepID=UPI0037AB416E
MSGGDTGRRVIDGRFALEARLGGGGMGTVWRARDLVLDRAVALKEVRPPDPALAEYDPEGARTLRARVLREARALARVDHPNVVTIHHVVDGGEDTYPWLVMELVTGGSLQDLLDLGPLEPAEAARLGREVLAALRAAHAVGIQHRDVKPANVLLRRDGRPVLTDFGIAAIRESAPLTATGSMIGTPDYMAPERITGDDGGPGSDLWSLAMMLYVAVEGHHPLRRGTALATLAAVLSEPLPPPLRAGAMTGVLSALLVRDPAARPDPETVDRMLAQAAHGATVPPPIAAGPRANPVGPQVNAVGPVPVATGPQATGAPPATSYRLTPPGGAATVPPGGAFGPPLAAGGVPPGAGAPTFPGADALVSVTAPHPADEVRRRMFRRVAFSTSILSTVLTGVLVWALLPGPDGKDDNSSSAQPGTGSSRSGAPDAGPTTSSGPSRPDPDTGTGTGEKQPVNLLTPDGIRTAVKALKAEMGTDQVGRFAVYPEYASVWGMVKGSKKRYDSYTYRVDGGVTRDPSSGTLSGGDLPVGLDTFDWDVVPALVKRAEKDLNVKKPTSRYLLVRQPNEIFDDPAGIAVYLSDEYDGGYLEADRKGKVTRVMPSES